jgi:hypothetical protein
MYARYGGGTGLSFTWVPVLAGRATKVIAYTPGTLTAGTVTVKVSRKTKTGGAACPGTRTDPDDPAAVINSGTNIAHDGADPGVAFGDDDVLGLRAITDAGFVPASSPLGVIAGVYFERE